MRKLFLITALAISNIFAFAQPYTFTNTTDYTITDNDSWANDGFIHGAESPITVSGIPPTSEIDYIIVNIAHTWDSDVDIYLAYYDNRYILSSSNGSSGDNYTNTKFIISGADLSTASAPFTGDYAPQDALPKFGDPDYTFNPNGEWVLNVCDHASGDEGTLLDWTIVFKEPACPTVDFIDEDNWNMTCDSAVDILSVTDMSTSGGSAFPTLYFEFNADDIGLEANNSVVVYEDGGVIYSGTVTNNQRLTVYTTGPFMSPSSVYTVDVANTDGTTDWLIYDGNGTVKTQGTVTNSSQTNLGACSPGGIGTWTGTGITVSTDYGYGVFDPSTVGAGTYNVTYTWDNEGSGAFNCSGSSTHTITVTNPHSAAWTPPAAMCPEAANVNLTALVTGDAGGTWAGTGVSGTNFLPATAGSGTHSITYTYDAGGGCEVSESHNIVVHPAASANAGTDDDLCIGQTTAQLNASGGTSYSWTPTTGLSNASINNPTVTITSNQTYTVEVTDANGCKATDDVTITANTPPTASASGNDVCVGEALNLTSGPNSMTSYAWSGPSYSSNTQNPTVSTSATTTMGGTYTVTITDGNGCTGTDNVTINVNPNPTPTIVGSISVCASSTETYSVTNVAGHTYSWTVTGGAVASGAGTNSITVDWGTGATGNVEVTETVTSSSCSETASESITINPLPVVYAGQDQSIANGTSTSINDATVNGSGTPTGFDYSWSPAGDLVDANILHPTTNNLSTTTVFTLTVEDQTTHCTNSDDIQITITGGPLSVITSSSTAICLGETTNITSNGSNGSGTYTYSWTSNPTGFTASTQDITVSPTVNTTYTVVVDDGYNTVTTDVIVTVNPLPTVSISATPNDTLCAGIDLSLTATGNADTYVWNNSVINATTFAPTSTDYIVTATNTTTTCQNFDTITIVVNPLPTVVANSSDANNAICLGDSLKLFGSGTADTYTWDNSVVDNEYFSPTTTINYTITGEVTATGCSTTDTIEIIVNPNPTIDNIAVTDVTNCPNPDGTINITVSGGAPTYQYSIDAGNTLNSSNSFNGLNGGNYSIYIEDINGCSDTATATIVNPSAPSIDSVVVTDVLCNGSNTGQIIIYSNGAVNYSIDNGNTTQADSSFTGLNAGNYQIWIADAGQCQTVGSTNIYEPNAIELDSSVTPAICGSTGTAEVIASGGTNTFTYLWDNNSETTSSINNLAAGTYNCDVLDGNSCPASISVIVPDGGGIPDIIITNQHNPYCFGESTGSITAVLNNNNSPFTYTWQHNNSLNDSTANNLSAGTYYVTISDNFGCSDSDSITLGEPTLLEVSVTDFNNPNCYNDSTGSITVSANGGTGGYSYNWSNGSINQNLTNINAGNYILIVTDGNSCTETISQELVNPNEIFISDSIYYDNYSGAIEITVSGGTPNYAYLWSNGETNNITSNLLAGDYWITVTDAKGCSTSNYYKIEIPLIIPTVITPNNDGKNDKFRITNVESVKTISINIFNRWGDLIFNYSGTGMGYASDEWNGTSLSGKELPLGSYVYIIDINNGEETHNGAVTIVK